MVHATPTQVLLTTTLQSLVMPLAGVLAHAVSLIEQFLSHEPTPQAMATFERELSAWLREVGHGVMAWVCNRIEPENPADAPSRLWFGGGAYRRRRPFLPGAVAQGHIDAITPHREGRLQPALRPVCLL